MHDIPEYKEFNMLTFEEEILSKPIGQQGQAIIKRLERLLNELKKEKEE